ncbi:YfjI family protein [Falsiroseomonas sp. E2-1-a4]|uniref:YfjI family protein n=1 Tax=Falsiroseomonas sp. E2-1-a4 TaxID=3239299 RepID=UPI003F36ED41
MKSDPRFHEALAAASMARGHGEKRPLFRPLPPALDYPAQALGPLRYAAEAVQMRTQAPFALCAQSVLAATTLAVQAQRNVALPGSGEKPLTGLFVSVAESGERKSSVDRVALAPVYRIEERWRGENGALVDRFRADLAAWKEACEAMKKKHKGDRGLIRDGLLHLGSEPKPPPHPMLLIADPTPEALVLHLAEGRPWAGVFTAEGGVLIGGSAFNDESRMRTGALMNTLWDGDPIRRRRVMTGATFLPGRRCSAHIMMQAVVADRLFGDATLDGIGMLARVLLVAPESTAGTRMFSTPPDACRATLDAYNDRLTLLLTRPPVTRPDASDVLDPPALTLTPEAEAVWIAFHDHAERAIGDGGAWRPIRAFGAKAPEHAGRLAAVLATYADPDAMEIGAEYVACGIALAQHYAAEMLRLIGAASVTPELRQAAALLRWWQDRRDPQCHLAQIYQTGPGAIRSAAAARAAAATLEDHGWLRRLPVGSEVDGASRREAWELVE